MPTGQEVIDAVAAAFEGVQLPSRDTLRNDHCVECTETWQLFRDASGDFATWEAIAARTGRALPLSLLAPAAVRYYLPALIIWCVRDNDEVDVLREDLPHELSRRSVPGFEERARGFTPAQREAIALFLEWFQETKLAEGWPLPKSTLRHVPGAIAFWRRG